MKGWTLGGVAALAMGCGNAGGDGVDGSVCPEVSPTCPRVVPSYTADVAPILAAACTTTCHNPTGLAGKSEQTYAEVHAQASAILSQVNGCQMPPANVPPLTEEQRAVLVAWLRCGAPDN